ncbi:hypothetical protein L7F22_011616 [Adiantum nelumboides]|nr:hypothetical protein [Adiantum nelumboides]
MAGEARRLSKRRGLPALADGRAAGPVADHDANVQGKSRAAQDVSSDTTSGPPVAPSEVKAATEAGEDAPEAEKLAESMQEADEEAATFGGFTFIPPDPRAYYRRALELCIDYDLEQIRYQPEDEEVSLSILSRSHVELMAECALRWRIMGPYRAMANLDVIKYKYDRGEVPLDCISEALSSANRVIQDSGSLDWWTLSDRKLLVLSYTALFDSFMRFIHDAFQDILNVDADEIRPYIGLVEELSVSGLVKDEGRLDGEDVDLQRYAEDLKDRIRIMAIHEYTAKTTDLFSQQVDNEVVPWWSCSTGSRRGQAAQQAVQGAYLRSNRPRLAASREAVRLFFDDLESMKHQIVEHATRERDPLAFDDIFALYKRVGALLRMHHAFCPDAEVLFDISDWFEPHIRHWLINTEKKTTEWVNNAIASDSFVPIDSEGAVHSSSIDDLFGALQQPLDFILSLQWPDPYRNARFLTSLAKTISRSIEQYCHRVEELFMEELFPRTAEGQDANQKQSAWMVKAKQTLQGEKKVEPFHFQASSCVKLNNIEAARLLLDKLYNKMDADEQARIIKTTAPSVPDKEQRQRYIFTVKVVLGENLQPVKETSANARIDSFITLSDERGFKIAKTRTIYETSDPRWDETFDIPVESQMWLAATVWDRKWWATTISVGERRLLLRVSMEGEKDDILFYFGKAFRSLKRAESDMVRIIVDKMSIFIRQCLSRSVLKSLVRTSGINLDKALGNVKALYAQALAHTSANASVIPPVDAEAPKKQRPQQLTDQEIEEAILPLLDYLDETLGTLKGSLSESEALLVLTKVWKEVLNTIDCILLPPLSDSPSDMPQLSGKEVEVVFKWLSMLRNYFNAYDEETGVAHGVPLEVLQGPKYREIVSYTLHHDANTDDLMEACVREMQMRLRRAPSKRTKTKSVLQQRSLGTIKKRKADKRNDEQQAAGNDDNLDVVLRLLRMRSGTSDFLQQQFATMGSLQAAMGRGDTAQVTPPRAQQRRMSLKYRQDQQQRLQMSASQQSPQQQLQQHQQSPSARPNLGTRMSRIAANAALNSFSPSATSGAYGVQQPPPSPGSARDSRQYYR